MLVISDLHFALDALRRVVAIGDTLLILGDLVNLTDYRTGEGAIADVLGSDFARRSAAARGASDYQTMRALWTERAAGSHEDVRQAIGEALARQYEQVAEVLDGGHGYVIHGNVDRPALLRESLPKTFRYVHGEVVEIDGVRFGFAGGGVSTPVHADGEVGDDEMTALLADLGPVDVLCTHVPAAITALRTDVITGRAERGSVPILQYLTDTRPRLHLHGDIHQPQATTWRVGPTRCLNVGYFRATGKPLSLDPDTI